METVNPDKLIPVCDLQPAERKKLAEKSRVVEIKKGSKLDASYEYRWIIYLLSGSLDILDHGKYSYSLSAESAKALHPIFAEKDHKKSAVSTAEGSIVLFDREYFNTLSSQSILAAEELETIEVNETEGHLFQSIAHAFNQGLLELPSLPEIALKIKDAVKDPEVDVGVISKILEADPAIVARLLQVANSPIHRAMGPVNSIRVAVIRLGLATTRDLVISLSVAQLFKASSPVLMQRMKLLYEDSIEVAAIAYAIAKNATRLEPDSMLLAGLVHDIGVIPILTYIDKTGMIVDDMKEVEEIIKDLKIVVGSMVVTNWEMGEELLTVVENSENCERSVPDLIDTCDVILVSKIYHRLQHHRVEDIPKLSEVPAFKKLFPEEQGMALIKTILDEASEEVKEVKRLLKG